MSVIGGKSFALLSLVVLSFVIIYSIMRSRKAEKPIGIRRIAGLESLEEVVGRSTETGRPIHFTTGITGIEGGDTTARVLGGLELMAWMTRRAAHYSTQLVVTVCKPSTYAVTREIVRSTYVQEGKQELYNENMVRFISDDQFAYASTAANIMQEEKISGNIMVGGFGGEAILLAETGSALGAIQVAGDTNINQIPFFVVTCDYTLLGEEMFAAGASLGGNRDVLGSLRAQDFGKAVAVVLMIIGTILTTVGNPVLTNLLKW